MVWKDHPVIIVTTLVIAVAGLFWNIGFNMRGDRIAELETKLETCKISESLEARQLLEALRDASKELQSNLQIIAEVSTLREKNKVLSDKVQDLSQTLQSVKDESKQEITALIEEKSNIQFELDREKSALAAFFLHNENFTLHPGESKTFGKYDLTLGYVGYVTPSSIRIIFNNKESIINAGTVLTAQINGKTCQLILDRFVYSATGEPATFSFVVRDK
jgi:hypothetical protein